MKQVAESVNSVLSARLDTADIVINVQDICPGRLNAMVYHTCQILKEFEGKIKVQCRSQPCRQRSVISSVKISADDQGNREDRKTPVKSQENSSIKSAEDRDSFLTTTSKAVEEILRKEVSGITEALLADLSYTDYEQMESSSLLEIKAVADDIAETVINQVQRLEDSDATEKVESRSSLNEVGEKIKIFFAKLFARTSIYRIMAQLKTTFCEDAKAAEGQSMQAFKASVDALLQTQDDQSEDEEWNFCWHSQEISIKC